MISRIMLVCVIALIAYVILPAAGALFVRGVWKRTLARFRNGPSMTGFCVGFSDRMLRIRSDAPDPQGDFAVSPAKTLFFILRKTGECEKLAWNSVHLLLNGTTVCVWRADTRRKKDLCLFHEEKNAAALALRIGALEIPEHYSNPIKLYSIASGAFLEFGLFLQFIQLPDMSIASISALVAIFGKALPYCPPGLFFTLAAHMSVGAIGGQPTEELDKKARAKKNRQRKTAGLLLMTAGIVLNIGAVFFVIRRIGF